MILQRKKKLDVPNSKLLVCKRIVKGMGVGGGRVIGREKILAKHVSDNNLSNFYSLCIIGYIKNSPSSILEYKPI